MVGYGLGWRAIASIEDLEEHAQDHQGSGIRQHSNRLADIGQDSPHAFFQDSHAPIDTACGGSRGGKERAENPAHSRSCEHPLLPEVVAVKAPPSTDISVDCTVAGDTVEAVNAMVTVSLIVVSAAGAVITTDGLLFTTNCLASDFPVLPLLSVTLIRMEWDPSVSDSVSSVSVVAVEVARQAPPSTLISVEATVAEAISVVVKDTTEVPETVSSAAGAEMLTLGLLAVFILRVLDVPVLPVLSVTFITIV